MKGHYQKKIVLGFCQISLVQIPDYKREKNEENYVA